jgi:hypothetical protein
MRKSSFVDLKYNHEKSHQLRVPQQEGFCIDKRGFA